MERLTIDATADTGLDYEETPLSALAEKVAEWIAKYGPDAKLYLGCSYESLDCEIRYKREETDVEYGKRVERERRSDMTRQLQESGVAKLTREELFALRSFPLPTELVPPGD